MVFKENQNDAAKFAPKNEVPAAPAEAQASPREVITAEKKAPPAPEHRNGFRCRLEKDMYVIEPEKRPKNRRRLATVAVVLVAFLLTGSVFFYGNAMMGMNGIDAISANYSANYENPKKTGLAGDSEAAVLPDSEKMVSLRAVSVEKDMRVRFLGDDDFPIAGYSFEIDVVNPDGEAEIYRDDDRDGFIHIAEIDGGEYGVTMLPIDGFVTAESLTVKVQDKVQYRKIEDIEDQINSMADIDAATDDPQYGNTGNPDAGTPSPPPPAPPPPTDTIEYVDSRVEQKDGTTRYKGNINPESKRLYAKDGTLSNIIPAVDANGFLTGEYTLYEEPASSAGDSSSSDSSSSDSSQVGGDIDIFGKDSSGSFIYDITAHTEKITVYYGWQDLDGNRYYFDKNGNKVTGAQTIRGQNYTFDTNGVLQQTVASSKMLGIDISTWQNTIDWAKVKASGIEFAIIRAGFRGYGTGKIVEDDLFYTNLIGATNAGLRVGVYFFSQAINQVEAVEEASMVISLLQKYGVRISYPITIDSEWSGASGNSGRADSLSRADRTAVCVAFCETVRSAGYTPMIYASKSWFENNLSVSAFGNYKIWLAHYTPGGATSSYSGRYEMWQYTSIGSVSGISGGVDMNYGYLGY